MKKLKKTQTKTKSFSSRLGKFSLNKKSALLFVIVFAGIGSALLILTHAATPTANIEPENGTISSNAIIGTDSNASGGQYVQFKAPSSGSGGNSTRYYNASSSWNTKIPTSATFTDNSLLHTGGWWLSSGDYGYPVVKSSPSDPIVSVSVPASWGWPAGTLQLHIPSNGYGATGTDGSMVLIDGTTAYDFWQFNRSGNSATASAYAESDIVNGSGWGTANPFLGAGIHATGSALLAGVIMGNELTTGFNHALAVALRYDIVQGWPNYTGEAISADGSGGPFEEGQRLAIPRSTPMPAGLSPQAQTLWNGMQEYGAFVIDVAGGTQAGYFVADPISVPANDVNTLLNAPNWTADDLVTIGNAVRIVN